MIVHVVDPSALADEDALLSLTALEHEQAARFRFEKDARHWRACRSALRRILGEILEIESVFVPLDFAEFGKPFLRDPFGDLHFNLSHCHDLALVAVSCDGPVGVDLEAENRGRSLLGCEQAFCHPEEMATLPEDEELRSGTLLDLWTGKEALLKGLGTGMSLAPETVSLIPRGEHGAGTYPRLQGFKLHRLDHPRLEQHVARLAAPLSSERILIVG
ncbi:4'-phosphopantetheinyl transferase family protein [Luteolibacter luteus]|uniref:4'-phosphopantetheinyl transferase superfamily protein n=1 Tax=Luteolibacter luteus TaxID=2728835 RepID=A0A858RIK6_9BACT|nr:4'-phosphopantetheinyl transferase superfamily protein [Luteolibacter luteus]QJE95883.1 4'-phosphopantetheinyl transferase superfamily protein [Luteolibacter luteus]